MSKKVSDDQYKKTFSYKFASWFYGTEDPYQKKVEMKPQKEFEETKEQIDERQKEKNNLLEQIYNIEKNNGLNLFDKLYKILSVVFCAVMVVMLVVAVSYLPTFGNPNNPVNNEVADR